MNPLLFYEDKDKRTVFVRNLPYTVDENTLQCLNYFECASEIRLARDKETGKVRGFANVEFKTPEMAEDCVAVIESMGGLEVEGRKVYCEIQIV